MKKQNNGRKSALQCCLVLVVSLFCFQAQAETTVVAFDLSSRKTSLPQTDLANLKKWYSKSILVSFQCVKVLPRAAAEKLMEDGGIFVVNWDMNGRTAKMMTQDSVVEAYVTGFLMDMPKEAGKMHISINYFDWNASKDPNKASNAEHYLQAKTEISIEAAKSGFKDLLDQLSKKQCEVQK